MGQAAGPGQAGSGEKCTCAPIIAHFHPFKLRTATLWFQQKQCCADLSVTCCSSCRMVAAVWLAGKVALHVARMYVVYTSDDDPFTFECSSPNPTVVVSGALGAHPAASRSLQLLDCHSSHCHLLMAATHAATADEQRCRLCGHQAQEEPTMFVCFFNRNGMRV